jgi:hypothetical protein
MIKQCSDYFAGIGIPSDAIKTAIQPTSWVAAVRNKTSFNELVERWRCGKSSYNNDNNAITAPVPGSSDRPQAETNRPPPDVLYELLATRHCSAEHSALLQLAGSSRLAEDKAIFHMFLSCCAEEGSEAPRGEWHKTVCTLDRLVCYLVIQKSQLLLSNDFPRSPPPPSLDSGALNICSDIRFKQRFRTPLLLSFNDQKCWYTAATCDNVGSRVLMEEDRIVRPINLKTRLQQQESKADDFQNKLKRFDLARRLALSLHELFPGPWIQREWTADYIQVIRDQAYIWCDFAKQESGSHSLQTNTAEIQTYRRFFLSVAQLFVDLEKSGRVPVSADDNLDSWHDRLYEEVIASYSDRITTSYQKAIQGCLLFLDSYITESQWNQDERSSAQEVIRRDIVLHMEKNYDLWKEQRPSEDSVMCEVEKSQSSYYPRPEELCQSVDNTSHYERRSRREPGPRESIKPILTLWSTDDEDFKIMSVIP